MAHLRIGAVSFLNTKPLIGNLTRLLPDAELVLAVPSRLALDLEAGRLDVALIPSIEYFRSGRYTILPGVSIASFGPVMSVKLCSRRPFAEIDRVAMDVGSRTSVCLCRLLLQHLFDVTPAEEPLPMHRNLGSLETDAMLVIGDRAMRIPAGAYPYTLDLGYEWSRWTGLPFVWAFWAVAEGVTIPFSAARAFFMAKELGRPAIPAIAAEEAARLKLDVAQCQYYLQQAIRHDLGVEELAGLERFRQLAVAAGMAPEGVPCVFHGERQLIESG